MYFDKNQNVPLKILEVLKEIDIKRSEEAKRRIITEKKNEDIRKYLRRMSEEDLTLFCVKWLSNFACNEKIVDIFNRYCLRFIPLDENFALSNLKRICIRKKEPLLDEVLFDELPIELWSTGQQETLASSLYKEVKNRHLDRGGGEIFRLASTLVGIYGNVWDNLNTFLRENFLK